MQLTFRIVAICASVFTAQSALAETVAIKAGRLIDVRAGKALDDRVIIVEDDKITAVGPSATTQIPSGAKVIDLSRETVMPGFVDTHTHITSDPTISPYDRYALTPAHTAVIGAGNARKTLHAGFTTIRNVGASGFADLALRDGIARGDIPGPRIFGAGQSLGITGGHCDDNHLAPQYNSQREGVADGVDAVRRMVRYNIKFGADLIKYCATGGVFSKGTKVGAPQYSQEEMNVLVAEAHSLGRTVAAHAHGAEGIKMAIRAGVDSIEHASLVDDEGIAMAKRAGTVFSMDIYNTDYTQAEGVKNGVSEESLQKDRDIADIQRENFRKALRAGVKLTYGSDAGVYPNGDNAKQFAIMVRYGMTPMQAIVAATLSGAQLLRKDAEIGVIEPGRYADIVAVREDPLADITALERINFVMKNGAVYKGAPEACAASPSAWACEAP